MKNTLVNNVSYCPQNRCECFVGKTEEEEEKTFYAPNVTQTARKTNMTYPEDDMMRDHACMDKNQTFAKNCDMFSET